MRICNYILILTLLYFRYSTDTLYSYTQTFDSDDEFSSEPEEVDSGTETTESPR